MIVEQEKDAAQQAEKLQAKLDKLHKTMDQFDDSKIARLSPEKERVVRFEKVQDSNSSSDNEDLMDEQTKALYNQLIKTVDSDGRDSSRNRKDYSYKNKAYWNLPENVRNAIDLAKMKQKHSEFYYKLQTLNDKIYVFRTHFYTRMPAYQKAFIEKK